MERKAEIRRIKEKEDEEEKKLKEIWNEKLIVLKNVSALF